MLNILYGFYKYSPDFQLDPTLAFFKQEGMKGGEGLFVADIAIFI